MLEASNNDLERNFVDKALELSKYFRHEDFYYKNIYDLILREGKLYKSQPFTSEENKSVTKRIRSLNGTFAPHQCFSNSGKLAMADHKEKIKYVEGFIFKEEIGIPILHAWNEINGKVIDITLINKYGEYTIGTFENDISYIGVTFPTRYVRKIFCLKSRSLLDDVYGQWPVLKNQFTSEYINSL